MIPSYSLIQEDTVEDEKYEYIQLNKWVMFLSLIFCYEECRW